MPFPAKFRFLLEESEFEAEVPDVAWLSFAVCAVEEESCGWKGWIIESVWKNQTDGVDSGRRALDAANNQKCPHCSRPTFRTGLEKQYVLNPVQPPKLNYSYKSSPMTYEGKSE